MTLELNDILHTGPATMEDAPNADGVRIIEYDGQWRCQVYDGMWRYFGHEGETLSRIHATTAAALAEAEFLRDYMTEETAREAGKREAASAWLSEIFGKNA